MDATGRVLLEGGACKYIVGVSVIVNIILKSICGVLHQNQTKKLGNILLVITGVPAVPSFCETDPCNHIAASPSPFHGCEHREPNPNAPTQHSKP